MSKRELTVGCVDMADFMVMLNRRGIDDLVKSLHAFYRQVGDIIYEHNGRIIKYLGDAVLFVFDDAREAMAAVRKIVTTKVEGCGIYGSLATGEIYEGRIGHPDFQAIDVLGTAVNKVFMLLKQAKSNPDHIMVCEETRNKIDTRG